jgi:NADPH-dependent 2,4-dienoyl-CoA reductase/sulfur reductase-like enzyme
LYSFICIVPSSALRCTHLASRSDLKVTLTAGHAAVAMSAATAAASGEQRLLAGAGGEDHSRVIVAGAGLAGLATAVALHKVGATTSGAHFDDAVIIEQVEAQYTLIHSDLLYVEATTIRP